MVWLQCCKVKKYQMMALCYMLVAITVVMGTEAVTE